MDIIKVNDPNACREIAALLTRAWCPQATDWTPPPAHHARAVVKAQREAQPLG